MSKFDHAADLASITNAELCRRLRGYYGDATYKTGPLAHEAAKRLESADNQIEYANRVEAPAAFEYGVERGKFEALKSPKCEMCNDGLWLVSNVQCMNCKKRGPCTVCNDTGSEHVCGMVCVDIPCSVCKGERKRP